MHQDHPFNFPITCSCGKSYSRDAWTTLISNGVQSGYHAGKSFQFFEDLELRRCACGSTLSVPARLMNQYGYAFHMAHRCEHCGSDREKVRSPRTGIEYCLQCSAAVSGIE